MEHKLLPLCIAVPVTQLHIVALEGVRVLLILYEILDHLLYLIQKDLFANQC